MKRSKNKNRIVPLARRVISVTTAMAIAIGCMPAADVGHGIKRLSSAINAFAEGPSPSGNLTPTTWNSKEDIISYAQNYDPAVNNRDEITIAIADGDTSGEISGFHTILSTQQYPFEGKIILTANASLSIAETLFDWVGDNVVIEGDLTILRKTASESDQPLFAKHVKSCGNTGSNAWNLAYKPVQNSFGGAKLVCDFAGFIGTIETGASVNIEKITFLNAGDSASANISCVTGDAGLVCGSMAADSSLKISEIKGVTSEANGETVYENISYSVTASATGKHAGGLVGSMGNGTTLTLDTTLVNRQANGFGITADHGYAGGIVGYCDGGTIVFNNDAPYQITQAIKGESGAGTIAGYFKNTQSSYTVPTDKISLSSSYSRVNGNGYCGGIFGKLENSGNMTINGTGFTAYHSDGNAASFGGLVGLYKAEALSNSLNITGSCTASRTGGSVSDLGGVIGIVDGASYVNINGVSANTPRAGASTSFGGMVGKASDGYIALEGTNAISYGSTALPSETATFGGVVGDLENGVLHLKGTTDLSGAPAVTTASADSGQVVGFRKLGLVFAESGWVMVRPAEDQYLDDVGSWGEIVRFGGNITMANVLTVEAGHYITLKSAVPAMASTDDFARTALNIQLNNGQDSGVIRCSGSNSSALLGSGSSLSLTSSAGIDLSGTGITGLTRDNIIKDETVPQTFSGTFNGNGYGIKLAIGEEYFSNAFEGCGKIYKHKYNGLFARTSGANISALKISADSSISVCAKESMYVGNVIAVATGGLTLTNIEICNDTASTATYATITGEGDSSICCGGIVGRLENVGNLVSLSGCKYNGKIELSAGSSQLGGIIGKVSGNTFGITLGSCTVGGKLKSTGASNEVGGTIGCIASTGDITSHPSSGRTLTLNALDIKGLEMDVTGNSGGFLGHNWYETDVVFRGISNGLYAANSGVTVDDNASLSATGETAGLVYRATGYWNVNAGGITLDSMSVTANDVTSFGLLVNKGYNVGSGETWGVKGNTKSSAIYMELAPGSYTVTKANVDLALNSVDTFDEIVAYTGSGSDVISNGQGVISIATANHDLLKMGSSDTNTGATYTHKTAFLDDSDNASLKFNSHSRYYYNLDAYRTSQSDLAQKLLVWSVNQYAQDSISRYFVPAITGNTIGSANTDVINLKGYSYYPIDLTDTITIKGNISFFNSDFDETESESADARVSDASDDQHYLIHNSLFRNVSGSMTVDIKLGGEVNNIDGYCGALIMGTAHSGASGSPALINVDGLVLNGIRIGGTIGTGSSDYAPLLINKAGSNVTMDISNVSNNDTSYSSMGTGTSAYIATSLFGDIGTTASQALKLKFSRIKLDGRNSTGVSNLSGLTAYHSTGSLFSKATLLNKLSYADNSGSYGVYEFTFDDDWGTGSRSVTYGSEIDSSVENADKQKWYKDDWDTPKYIRPDSSADVGSAYGAFATNFQNYVYTGYNASNKTHELRVNIKGADLSGCGTYNHPYTITSGAQIEAFAKMINGTLDTSQSVIVPISISDGTASNVTWCGGDSSETTVAFSNDNVSVRKYLAGAYYVIASDDLELSADFEGFSSNVADDYVFRGVIDGRGNSIKNKSNKPLIVSSNGSVVRNLTIKVEPTTSVKLTQNSAAAFNSLNGGCEAYGAVIGRIFGGDNIIENVKVDFSYTTVELVNANTGTATKAQLVPIGGYVGVIVNGGLIFRDMTGKSTDNEAGLTSANLTGFGTGTGATDSNPLAADNTKWLYVNPIIGRVINGYAVTESTSYKPFENGERKYGDGTIEYWLPDGTVSTDPADAVNKVGVTMRNGTKNYSITDIDKSDLGTNSSSNFTINSNTITVKNAQAFFLMSVMVNCGMSKSLLGYTSGQNYVFRGTAAYDEVGITGVTQAGDYAKAQYAGSAINDNTKPELQRYLYLANSSTTIAKIADNSAAIIKLVNADYYLPDGYKGIGNIFYDPARKVGSTYPDRALFMQINTFTGNDAVISQNTTYDYYSSDYEDYLPVQGRNDKNNNSNAGLGLFNSLYNNSSLSGFYLKGNVKSHVYQYSGQKISYGTNTTDKKYVLSVGSLFGSIASSPTIKNVAIVNVDVYSARNTGGLIGYADSGTVNYEIKSDAPATSYNSDKIISVGGCSTGGMIGKIYAGNAKVDMHDHTFNLTRVECEATKREGNDYDFGVGGFIGFLRKGSNGYVENANYFRNIVIGTEENSQVVKCNGADIYTAGVIGIVNKTQGVSIENCTFYNLSVESKFHSGGLVAFATTWSPVYVDNVNLYSPIGSTIKGDGYAGGFVGTSNNSKSSNNNGDGSRDFVLKNCSIDGYIISGGTGAGGLIGYRGAYTDIKLEADNFSISNCTIKSDTTVGTLAGKIDEVMYGFDIYSENVSLDSITSGATISKGYICGTNASKIKLVGFTRQGSIGVDKMVGNSTSASDETYGSGGYVIFADYDNAGNNSVMVGEEATYPNRCTSMSNMATSGSNVTYSPDTYPYVISSPKTLIFGSSYLTGDGASGAQYANSTPQHIISAIQGGSDKKRYQNTGMSSSEITELRSFLNESMMTIKKVDGRNSALSYTAEDFPVLVVQNIDTVDDQLNSYLQLLTNTSYDYSQSAANAVFNVDISKWKSTDGSTFSKQSGELASLRLNDDKFTITSAAVDNLDWQFSLVDVQFFDPSGTGGIAYHLYVPVVVKKCLNYKMMLRPSSGSTYDLSAYSQATGNNHNLIENLGNPITIKLTYVYDQSASDWQDAINNGEKVYRNFTEKKLSIRSSGTAAVPDNAIIAIVDPNNNKDKLYSKPFSSSDFISDEYILDINTFIGNEMVNLNDLMTVSINSDPDLPDSEKHLVEWDPATDSNDSIVVEVNSGTGIGTKLRLEGEGDSGKTHFAVNVEIPTGKTKIDNEFKNYLEENYYISIFTQEDENDTSFYHYEINGQNTFGDVSHPSVCTHLENSHIILGNLFDNRVKSFEENNGQRQMSDENTTIGAVMTAEIGFSEIARNNHITSYIEKNKNVEIYHSFLVALNKMNANNTSEFGIQVNPAVALRNCSVDGSAVNVNDYSAKVVGSYVEIAYGNSLKNAMVAAAGRAKTTVDVSLTVDMTYATEFLAEQFPSSTEDNYEVGTYMIGYSNLSSSPTNGAASHASADTRSTDSSRLRYYIDNLTSVDLNYKAAPNENNYIPGNGDLGQLGINARELDENQHDLSVNTAVTYDASGYSMAGQANYIKITVMLSKKSDYSAALPIDKYFSSFEILGAEGSGGTRSDLGTLGYKQTTTDNTYVYIVPISDDALEKVVGDYSYRIPINFSVYSGDNDYFENSDDTTVDMEYSNYRVTVTVGLLKTPTDGYLTSSDATDHIVYTNAKLISDIVTPRSN